jgi:nitrite reductase/ring-hydroxylating ferredoxin subunit/uncharacterized membrane protein
MAIAAPHHRRLTPAEPLMDRVEGATALDALARTLGRKLRGLLAPGVLREALSGSWLGHPLHPLLTDVVIGSWMSANVLDLLGGREHAQASEKLIGVGIVAALPTAVTGASDWADAEASDDATRRTGIVHAVANSTALALYGASLLARRGGRWAGGARLSAVGALAMGVGAYLGGHISYARGVGVDRTLYDPGPDDDEWHAAIDASLLAEGQPERVIVEETPVMVVRRGAEVFAIHDRCAHRGCSLSVGRLEGEEIECACHGSRYSLRDGALRRGPATAPQPAFEVRERGGTVELRRRRPVPAG